MDKGANRDEQRNSRCRDHTVQGRASWRLTHTEDARREPQWQKDHSDVREVSVEVIPHVLQARLDRHPERLHIRLASPQLADPALIRHQQLVDRAPILALVVPRPPRLLLPPLPLAPDPLLDPLHALAQVLVDDL